MKYEGMYWTDEFDPRLKRILRIYGEGYTAPIVVDAWQQVGKNYGIPRQFARNRGFEGEEKTVRPRVKWPTFKGSYRYNQQEVCDHLEKIILQKHGALMESPTGWGKTFAALNIAQRLNTRALVLVHKQDLIKQWQKSAKDFYKVSCGRIQQDTWDTDHPVVVGMIQTLKARGIPKGLAKTFGLVIVDEGHHIPCTTCVDVLSQLPGRFRLGVSATWRRTDKLDDLWKWHIGDIEAKGVRPKLPAVYYQFPIPCSVDDRKFFRNGKINHSAMITAIAENPKVNQMLVNEINAARKKNRKILVVSQRTAQLDTLHRSIPDAGVYAGKYRGSTVSKKDLDAAAKKQVILATYKKISEGTDIPALDTLILGTPCADPEQVYGRVSRESPNKKEIVVVDPIIQTSYNYALAAKRKKVYERLGIRKG